MFFFFPKSSLARERGVCSGNANAEGMIRSFFFAHTSHFCRTAEIFFDAVDISRLSERDMA